MREAFDIGHSRWVFTHVADKAWAFSILAALTKPGGYVIYGDRNTCGGIQEMLQRLAIYRLGGKNDTKIVEIAEALFPEDIDRSQRAVPRTREAIIFDRWVIQQQDDPSVDEILRMFRKHGLAYVSSWPRIDFPGRGASTFSDPRNEPLLREGARMVENLWMILCNGEEESLSSANPLPPAYYTSLAKAAGRLRNLQIGTVIDPQLLAKSFARLAALSRPDPRGSSQLNRRLAIFFREIETFLDLIASGKDLKTIRKKIKGFSILFRGYAGVRRVDFVAYKPR